METPANAVMSATVDPLSRNKSNHASAQTVERPNAHAKTANVDQAVQALERWPNHAAQENHAHAATVVLANARTNAHATRANALAALTDRPRQLCNIHNKLIC